MGNPLRNSDPSAFRLVTIRTQEARLFMAPTSNKISRLLGGIIARYQELLGINIYAYCFLSNHYHMLIKAPRGNADEFFENVNREISRRMNWRLRREGAFWGRRYSEQFVLSEDDLLEAFLYITTNPTKHGLLADSSSWPGLNSYSHSVSGRDRSYSFTHYSAPEGEPRVTRHLLKISALPQFEGLKLQERGKVIEKLLRARTAKLVAEQGEAFLTLECISSQDPFSKPQRISKSPRPSVYTFCKVLFREFMRELRERRDAYARASQIYRLGQEGYEFPEHSYPPPKIRIPRMFPFVLVPEAVS